MTVCCEWECARSACIGITTNLGNYSVIQYYCKQHDPTIKRTRLIDELETTNTNYHIIQSDEREVKEYDDFAEGVIRDWNERNGQHG